MGHWINKSPFSRVSESHPFFAANLSKLTVRDFARGPPLIVGLLRNGLRLLLSVVRIEGKTVTERDGAPRCR
jgi:hypothetical protein